MINKTNWRLVNKFLSYRLNVDQLSKGSMRTQEIHTRYLLEWAQDTSFRNAPTIRPTFPQYLLENRISDKEGQLSPVYIKKTLATARLFFTWLSDNEAGYKQFKQAWIKTLKAKRLAEVQKNKEYVTLQEIMAIASRPVNSVWERRTRASLIFLYLSGMRINAFVSLPVRAVDIANRCVYQYPEFGVRTKNNKSAKTFLLDIPELLKIVKEWDTEVRASGSHLWFAPLSPETGLINPSIVEAGEHRHAIARRNFRKWLKQEGLPYYSPHKFRHGHIHYGLEHAENIADFKAVSMNAMHSNMEITDTFYSVLQDDEVKQRISNLNKKGKPQDKSEVVKILKDLIKNLENSD